MKKLLMSFMIALLVVPCMFLATACGGGGGENAKCEKAVIMTTTQSSVGTTSVNTTNPEDTSLKITLVVDEDNKVVSVNLDNENAGTIYANITFTGNTVEEAAQIFIELGTISGYIKLNISNNFYLEVTGDVEKAVTDLKEAVETKVKEVCDDIGVDVNVTLRSANEALASLRA